MLGHRGQQVADEVRPAALAGRALEPPARGRGEAAVRVGDHQEENEQRLPNSQAGAMPTRGERVPGDRHRLHLAMGCAQPVLHSSALNPSDPGPLGCAEPTRGGTELGPWGRRRPKVG